MERLQTKSGMQPKRHLHFHLLILCRAPEHYIYNGTLPWMLINNVGPYSNCFINLQGLLWHSLYWMKRCCNVDVIYTSQRESIWMQIFLQYALLQSAWNKNEHSLCICSICFLFRTSAYEAVLDWVAVRCFGPPSWGEV